MFTCQRVTWSKLLVKEVPAQVWGGEETPTHLDVIGWVSTYHTTYHRDLPTEFVLVLGVRKERAERAQRSGGALC